MQWILDHTYIGLKNTNGGFDWLALLTLVVLIAAVAFVWSRLRAQRREKTDLEDTLSSADAAKIPVNGADI